MRRLAALLALLAVPAVARAQIIDPGTPNWIVPYGIQVVGRNNASQPDPAGSFTVVIRDQASNPVANAMVTLDFSACSDLKLCATQLDPAVTVDCAQKTVSKAADVQGVATFVVQGWSIAPPGGPGPSGPSMDVYADGVLGAHVAVAILDRVGGQGLSSADLSAWLTDFFAGNPVARGDYDWSGALGASDLSRWLTAYFSNGSVINCGSVGESCP